MSKESKRKKIVVIGGGKGTAAVLSALKPYSVELSAVVAMADDGGSTGVLRREMDVHPPGSVRPALVALARNEEAARLFEYRFQTGGLKGHTVGNFVIAGFENLYGNFEKAVAEAGKMLDMHGKVIPSTLDRTTLCAELEDGSIIRGETEIDIPKQKNRPPIKRVWLEPKARLNPGAREAILRADMIVIGPGDLYTSIIPNFLVFGMPHALRKSKAKKVFIINAVNKKGETDGFTAGDFVQVLQRFLDRDEVHFVCIPIMKRNTKKISIVRPGNVHAFPSEVIRSWVLSEKNAFRYDSEHLGRMLISLLKK